ncbi:GNAT family N-acetyltransferase [Novosphingobium sp. KA1]|uniref:GNAT family N-acetyltransferase n=1 Tax=Novosphingobium sp. (strain KA1) TaxID=164608 RepID=UPI001F5C1629|nr:GNAT family N-acetyltransferase [Novosphingobium sp. KA1]
MTAPDIRVDDPAAAHVAPLLEHHLRELAAVMGEHAFALDASGLSAPGVTFWTAWRGGALAGFAALKELDKHAAEVKSMRAAPDARGTGVGRALLDHVVAEARARGHARLYLETGTAPLHQPAIGLYRSRGFTSCPPFADYEASPHNQFMMLALSPAGRTA